MTVFSVTEKFKTRTFQLSVNIFYAKENIILSFFCFFMALKHHSARFLKNTKERSSFYQLPALEKKPETHNINLSFTFILIRKKKARCETKLKNSFSDFSMVRTWYTTMLVPSKIPLRRIWHLNFAETKKSYQYFNWNSYQPWSNTPYKK